MSDKHKKDRTLDDTAIGFGNAVTASFLSSSVKQNYLSILRARHAGSSVFGQIFEQAATEGPKITPEACKKKLCDRLKKNENFEKNLIATLAVGMAAANADGAVSTEAEKVLDELLACVSASSLPIPIKQRIAKFYSTPPTFEQAMELAVECRCKAEDIELVIELAIYADKRTSPQKADFISRWNKEVRSLLAS